jgi:hypothetical protein
MAFAAQFKVFNDPKFYPNGVVVATEAEAQRYGNMKYRTWMQCEGFQVVPSDAEPNFAVDEQGLLTEIAVTPLAT